MPSFLWSESVVEECAEKSTLHADARFAYLVLIVVELPEEDCRKEGGYAVCCGDAYPYSVCAPIVGEDEKKLAVTIWNPTTGDMRTMIFMPRAVISASWVSSVNIMMGYCGKNPQMMKEKHMVTVAKSMALRSTSLTLSGC